ncbi:MAG: hypothetical protein HYU66_00480, partial [Armatimonadetes bacterium]|nr:hypothetical protein [Armatimonadota bacterium]
MRKRTSEGQALPVELDDLLAFGDPGRYDPVVPTPRQALGYDLGERLSTHADCLAYLRALAQASPRARFATFGASVEGRELMQLTVSSPSNLARLDAIRADILALADPAAPLPDLAELPVIVWIIANVHGGEHSTAEAALALAYHLCAATDEAALALLHDAVVVIDPLQNPDGRDRSVQAFRSLHGLRANPDPNSCEHNPPWPGPRGSHYAFDLNRDWCLLTHPESRARVESFLAWRPQVVADLHKMGCNESYYFPPPAVPVEVNVAESLRAWWELFGRANAAAFDARGWDYFVGETFDSYYPGYGEAWPLYHGALGMTYEQASPRTLGVRRHDDRVLTLREALGKHFVAAYTTCAVAAAHRSELLESCRAFHVEAVALGEAGPERALLIDAGDRPGDARELAELLRAQGVRVEQAGRPLTAAVTPHPGGPAEERTLAAGSLVIPLAQPAGRLVRALCSGEAPLPAEYVLEERERLRRRAEPNIYDITSWSLPHAHGLDAYWSGTVPKVAPLVPPRRVRRAGTAWLVPAGTRAAYRLACRVVGDEAWRPRLATRELRLDGRCFGRGTLVLRVNDHAFDLAARLADLAAETGAEVVPADTSWSEAGVRLGSIHVVAVRRPKIAMLTRPPVGAHSAGWLAYLLEQVYQLAYTPLDAGSLSEKVLSEYNVLLMPDSGAYG